MINLRGISVPRFDSHVAQLKKENVNGLINKKNWKGMYAD